MKNGLNSLSWKPLSSCICLDGAFGSLSLHYILQSPRKVSGQVIQKLAQTLVLMRVSEVLLGSCYPARVVGICTSEYMVSTRFHLRRSLQPKAGRYVLFLDILKSQEHLLNSSIAVTKVKSFPSRQTTEAILHPRTLMASNQQVFTHYLPEP